MLKNKTHYLLILPCLFVFLFFIGAQCKATKEKHNTFLPKQKGAHVFGQLDSTNLQILLQKNYEWITLVPYADQEDVDSPTMSYLRGDSTYKAQNDSIWKNQIDLAHAFGLKVFLKPHIWLYAASDGKWRSDIFPKNEENWKRWQDNYRNFILHNAHLAQKSGVELFCIGTEFSRLSVEKADFWENLIQEVRAVYSGKITYAANWYEEYEKITFWDKLDYIGIQAYFPLAKTQNPDVLQLTTTWNQYLPTIESIAKKYKRKVLFTEMGYKNTKDAAIEPWKWVEDADRVSSLASFETQANCYIAFFNTIWDKEWFAGVHIWQLRSDFTKLDERSEVDFTPQGKPAELVIAGGFK